MTSSFLLFGDAPPNPFSDSWLHPTATRPFFETRMNLLAATFVANPCSQTGTKRSVVFFHPFPTFPIPSYLFCDCFFFLEVGLPSFLAEFITLLSRMARV